MNLDIALGLAYIGLAAGLLAAMAGKRAFRASLVFFAYVCLDLISSVIGLAAYHYSGFSGWYLRVFYFEAVVDFVLYFGVLVELGRNLLRFNRESRPHWDVAIWLFLCACVLIFTLSRWADAPGRSWSSNIYYLGMRANELFQFAGFLALISWSTVRKLRWPERELRVTTGLGISAFGWFLVSLLHSQWSSGPEYHWFDQAGQAVDLLASAYWLHYFWIAADREASVSNDNTELDDFSDPGESGPTLRVRVNSKVSP